MYRSRTVIILHELEELVRVNLSLIKFMVFYFVHLYLHSYILYFPPTSVDKDLLHNCNVDYPLHTF